MGSSTTSNTPADVAVTKPIEGTTIWSDTLLAYFFATNADQAETQADNNVAAIIPTRATFNALDAANAGENVIRTAVATATSALSSVANISFTVGSSFAGSDLLVVGADNYGTSSSPLGNNVYGSMNFPGTNPDGIFFLGDEIEDSATFGFESYLLLNPKLNIMTQAPATGGGHFALTTVMHELGHGIGLGHPHDTGNGSTILAGATVGRADDVPLDNERYTIMSYESGGLNQDSPRTSGHAVTPMALDIAALHSMYGSRGKATGDSTYTLTNPGTTALDTSGDTISIGSAWYSIWDTGGTDEIKYSGATNVLLNLNDATLTTTDDATTLNWIRLLRSTDAFGSLNGELQNDLANPAYHAGGFFSRLFDGAGAPTLGGYSIANGVVVEKATGGTGNDIIIGNEAANTLTGNGGADVILGSAGNDTMNGGDGDDTLGGGEGNDSLIGGAGDGDVALFSEICRNYEIDKAEDGTITISHTKGSMADGVDILTGVETARFTDGDIDLTEDDPGCPPIDFIFLVDLSGSFSDDLPNFVASAPSIAATVQAFDPDAQFAVASFKDIPVSPFGGSGDYGYRPELALTDDTVAFQAALAGLSASGGGDFPEAQWVGLFNAAKGVGLGLREDSRKIILIATDAPAHSASDYGLSAGDITTFLADNAIDVIGGSTGREVADVGDVGDTDPDFDDGVEALFGAFADLAGFGSSVPIFAVTPGSTSFYETASGSLLTPGSVAPLGFSGDDIADAVSLAFAELAGEISTLGTAGDDSLVGTPMRDGIFGLGGNDTIDGLAGNDLLDGGADDDSIIGGDGDDAIQGGTGNDTISGGAGNDLMRPGLGLDEISTGDGMDTVIGPASELDNLRITDFSEDDVIIFNNSDFSTGDMTLTFGATELTIAVDSDRDSFIDATLTLDGDFSDADFVATAQADGTTRIEIPSGIIATDGPDLLVGTPDADTISGLGGDDTIRGLAGDDRLVGDEGDDRIIGGGGSDTVVGGDGDDFAKGNGGGDRLVGNRGADTLIGGGGGDVLRGGGQSDDLMGKGGGDTIRGGGGGDDIDGSGGNDRLFGNGGADVIEGGRGRDVMTGGGGRDQFFFDTGDGLNRITDFRQGQDKIAIGAGASSFDDLTITQAGDDVLVRFSNVQIFVEDDLVGAFTDADFIFT